MPLAAALALLIRAAGASAAAELQTAIQFEPIHMKIDLNGFGALQEIFIDDILIAVHIKFLIRVVGLIQSHGQAGTASAAFVQEDPNGTDLFVLEICRNLFCGCRCYFEHGVLLKKNKPHCISASGLLMGGWPWSQCCLLTGHLCIEP